MKTSPTNTVNGAGPQEFELENFLPYRLSLLTNTISQGMALSYRCRHEISVTEWRVMAVLGRFPGLTASEVVGQTAMDKVAISRAVKHLIQQELVIRTPDCEDRRKWRLHISPDLGQKALGEVVPLALEYEKRLLQSLDFEELGSLLRIIAKLQHTAIETNAMQADS